MSEQSNGVHKDLGPKQRAIAVIDDNAAKLSGLCAAGMDPDRLRQCFGLALMRNPDIAECTPASLVEAIGTAARLGLDPSGTHNSAHIIPFNVNIGTRDQPRWVKEAKLIPGYGGLIDVACRTGDISHIEVEAVFKGDDFHWQKGTEPRIDHVPSDEADRVSKPTHVYAVAWYLNGRFQFVVMSTAEVEKVRGMSRSKDSPAWKGSWTEMAKKTVIRRMMKVIRINPDAQRAVALVDDAEGFDHGTSAIDAGREVAEITDETKRAVQARREAAGANAEADAEDDHDDIERDPDTGEPVPSAAEVAAMNES